MIDFVKLCDEQNIPYVESGHHHCKEGWIQTHCPFCTDGTHGYHLGFNLDHGGMSCWRGCSVNVFTFLSSVLQNRKVSVKQIINQYSQTNFVSRENKAKPRRRKAKKPLYMESLLKTHTNYLSKIRKFNLNIIDEWDLKGTKGLSGVWSWRVIAPVRDIKNNIVAYTGRAINSIIKTKWNHTKKEDMSIDPKKMLYGIEKVTDKVIIVEGPGDVWRLGPGAVALFGIDWKIEQAAILKNFAHRYIMFDPETLAQKQAKKLADWLAPFPGETEIITGFDTDPGDLKQSEADNIMEELCF